MEIIKNYLESMFASLPDTPEVRRAREELWQMMEDKYTELIEDGENENTAIGTVIAEFGNLDELADDLGLRDQVDQDQQDLKENPRRLVTMDEVKEFFKSNSDNANRKALGVLCCIICPIGPILAASFGRVSGPGMKAGVIAMFVLLAIAIASFIFAGVEASKWRFLKKSRCVIDITTANFVNDELNRYRNDYTMKLTIGIILCALCWLPTVILAGVAFRSVNLSVISAAILLILVGLGVFLLVQNANVKRGFLSVLRLNGKDTMAGSYAEKYEPSYRTEKEKTIMELYWPTVTCIYLILSFLTFEWGITWIVWPQQVSYAVS